MLTDVASIIIMLLKETFDSRTFTKRPKFNSGASFALISEYSNKLLHTTNVEYFSVFIQMSFSPNHVGRSTKTVAFSVETISLRKSELFAGILLLCVLKEEYTFVL